ncbi:hypothetical protein HW115_09805 [Verrucomicrobiaceae bacterium N1E253]|uniref:PhoD-like phosphatase metallophosphatase domain-containing protein n=1 Tax=Oceaniferula marina TaxID=2748318 RepID=A0A851GER1_9BACT|nr:alkaline phosphatase D family protein [Oceaniferula marina]NWK55906.1 hypothetical protein [Oceaniferula marina]
MNHLITTISAVIALTASSTASPDFKLDWDQTPDQQWTGPSTWANRLQDWNVHQNRVECTPNRNLPMRTLHLLSHDVEAANGSIELNVDLGRLDQETTQATGGAAGFLIGAGRGKMDYRAASIVHQVPGPGAGLFTGVDLQGRVFIHDNELGVYGYDDLKPLAQSKAQPKLSSGTVKLSCSATKQSNGTWKIEVTAKSADGKQSSTVSGEVPEERILGNLALVANPGGKNKDYARFWFDNWAGKGEGLKAHTDRSFGPVAGTQYTVSRRILKINAQMVPLPAKRLKGAILEVKKDGKWQKIATTDIDPVSFTALFRVENWDDTQDVPYRVTAPMPASDEQAWGGTIRRNPREKEEFAVAAFTGNHNFCKQIAAGPRHNKGRKGSWIEGSWFPHADLVDSISAQNPDLLFFSGDQVYEAASPSFPDRAAAELDYLYKWYLYVWAFRDLTCDIPTVSIPDDHDVFQGNFWGQGGRAAKRQNDGGYVYPAEFVKMVERTQTDNLPDPYDPTPVEQGIGVYYTGLNWGPMSFAIIEDRKFKTGPDSDEVKSGDKSKLVLLGGRQMKFLNEWVGDWSDGAAMKASLTATIFAQLHTWRNKDGSIEQDKDTNGWPVAGRNEALRSLRKGYTLMIGGDQHLATTAHHGVDEFGDSGWSICVPSIANYFPRSWKPIKAGMNRKPGQPEWAGDHHDSWGNKVSMYAVANPGKESGHKPELLHDRVPGYGIIRFNQKTRNIEMANWPRYATVGKGEPYEGWPVTVSQQSNYGRNPVAYLPEIFSEKTNPVVKVIEKKSGELVYALRINGNKFTPGVFAEGEYTVKVGEPDTKEWAVLSVKTGAKQETINLGENDFDAE